MSQWNEEYRRNLATCIYTPHSEHDEIQGYVLHIHKAVSLSIPATFTRRCHGKSMGFRLRLSFFDPLSKIIVGGEYLSHLQRVENSRSASSYASNLWIVFAMHTEVSLFLQVCAVAYSEKQAEYQGELDEATNTEKDEGTDFKSEINVVSERNTVSENDIIVQEEVVIGWCILNPLDYSTPNVSKVLSGKKRLIYDRLEMYRGAPTQIFSSEFDQAALQKSKLGLSLGLMRHSFENIPSYCFLNVLSPPRFFYQQGNIEFRLHKDLVTLPATLLVSPTYYPKCDISVKGAYASFARFFNYDKHLNPDNILSRQPISGFEMLPKTIFERHMRAILLQTVLPQVEARLEVQLSRSKVRVSFEKYYLYCSAHNGIEQLSSSSAKIQLGFVQDRVTVDDNVRDEITRDITRLSCKGHSSETTQHSELFIDMAGIKQKAYALDNCHRNCGIIVALCVRAAISIAAASDRRVSEPFPETVEFCVGWGAVDTADILSKPTSPHYVKLLPSDDLTTGTPGIDLAILDLGRNSGVRLAPKTDPRAKSNAKRRNSESGGSRSQSTHSRRYKRSYEAEEDTTASDDDGAENETTSDPYGTQQYEYVYPYVALMFDVGTEESLPPDTQAELVPPGKLKSMPSGSKHTGEDASDASARSGPSNQKAFPRTLPAEDTEISVAGKPRNSRPVSGRTDIPVRSRSSDASRIYDEDYHEEESSDAHSTPAKNQESFDGKRRKVRSKRRIEPDDISTNDSSKAQSNDHASPQHRQQKDELASPQPLQSSKNTETSDSDAGILANHPLRSHRDNASVRKKPERRLGKPTRTDVFSHDSSNAHQEEQDKLMDSKPWQAVVSKVVDILDPKEYSVYNNYLSLTVLTMSPLSSEINGQLRLRLVALGAGEVSIVDSAPFEFSHFTLPANLAIDRPLASALYGCILMLMSCNGPAETEFCVASATVVFEDELNPRRKAANDLLQLCDAQSHLYRMSKATREIKINLHESMADSLFDLERYPLYTLGLKIGVSHHPLLPAMSPNSSPNTIVRTDHQQLVSPRPLGDTTINSTLTQTVGGLSGKPFADMLPKDDGDLTPQAVRTIVERYLKKVSLEMTNFYTLERLARRAIRKKNTTVQTAHVECGSCTSVCLFPQLPQLARKKGTLLIMLLSPSVEELTARGIAFDLLPSPNIAERWQLETDGSLSTDLTQGEPLLSPFIVLRGNHYENFDLKDSAKQSGDLSSARLVFGLSVEGPTRSEDIGRSVLDVVLTRPTRPLTQLRIPLPSSLPDGFPSAVMSVAFGFNLVTNEIYTVSPSNSGMLLDQVELSNIVAVESLGVRVIRGSAKSTLSARCGTVPGANKHFCTVPVLALYEPNHATDAVVFVVLSVQGSDYKNELNLGDNVYVCDILVHDYIICSFSFDLVLSEFSFMHANAGTDLLVPYEQVGSTERRALTVPNPYDSRFNLVSPGMHVLEVFAYDLSGTLSSFVLVVNVGDPVNVQHRYAIYVPPKTLRKVKYDKPVTGILRVHSDKNSIIRVTKITKDKSDGTYVITLEVGRQVWLKDYEARGHVYVMNETPPYCVILNCKIK